jgi:hypothetical protein
MAGNRHDHHTDLDVRPDPNRPETLFEHRDVNTWAVGKFGIGLALLCILAVGILYGVFRYFEAREGGRVTEQDMSIDAGKLPPKPRLQEAPVRDLEAIRAAEDRLLNSYGWVDEQKGVARIPIARAMELLAARPPASAAGEAPPKDRVTVPTESGLGAIVQQPGGPLAAELEGARPAGAATHEAGPAPGAEKK